MGEHMEEVFNPFPGDSYDTPENTSRSILDYAMLGCRASFYIRNFYVFCQSGREAKSGIFPQNRQTIRSLENFRIVESCGGRFHLRGLDNLNKTSGAAVVIGNHMSLLETAVLHAFVRPRIDFCFVIKQSLFDVPFFGDIMRHLDCIAVGRENPRDDFKMVMEEGKKRIEQGRSVVIFPQSTRSAVFRPSQFNTIGVKLAKNSGAPIIPLALRTDFLQNGKYIKDLGPIKRARPIHFEFGEPIMKVSGSGKAEHAMVVDFIKKRLSSWGSEIEEDSEAKSGEE